MATYPTPTATDATSEPSTDTVEISLADNPDLQNCREGEQLNVVSNDGTTLTVEKAGYGDEGGQDVSPDQAAIADRAMAMPLPRR